MKKLRVAIIGCGRISKVYQEVFKKNTHKIEVCFAVDKVINRAEKFALEFSNCLAFEDYREILDKEIDVVHICTPHFLHMEHITAFLKNSIAVLTEKPLAISMEEAGTILKIADETKTPFGIIFQNRYIEGVIKAKKMIEEGELGKIIGAKSILTWSRPPSYYECDWKGSWEKEGGGVLIDQAIHSIDLVQYLVGSPIEWIEGNVANRVLKTIEVEDVADAAIKFKNECIYSLFATNYYTYNAPIEIEIIGDNGKIELTGFDVKITIDNNIEIIRGAGNQNNEMSYWGVYHQYEIEAFYESIRMNSKVPIEGKQGLASLQIVLSIYESSKLNKKIFID